MLVVVENAGPVAAASSVRSCCSAQPSRRSSAMFWTMFTALPPSTGSGSAACNRRTGRGAQASGENRLRHGDHWSPC
eukprot:2803197-Prymnesium_polylepis.1